MIHDSFFNSEGVAQWTIRQRLLVLGMIAVADDQGRIKGNPLWLRSQIFPYDMISADDIASDLAAIAASNDTIRLYQCDGRSYIQLVNWWEYQSLQWANPSKCPAPDDWQDKVRQMQYKPERWVKTINWPGVDDRVTLLPNDITLSDKVMASGISNTNTNTNTNTILYERIRTQWSKYFPDKPQPRKNNRSLQGKVKTRMGSKHFEKHWQEAMQRASKSSFLHRESWFDLGWFLRNDEHYEKCLNGNYDDRRDNGQRPSKAMQAAHIAKELIMEMSDEE